MTSRIQKRLSVALASALLFAAPAAFADETGTIAGGVAGAVGGAAVGGPVGAVVGGVGGAAIGNAVTNPPHRSRHYGYRRRHGDAWER